MLRGAPTGQPQFLSGQAALRVIRAEKHILLPERPQRMKFVRARSSAPPSQAHAETQGLRFPTGAGWQSDCIHSDNLKVWARGTLRLCSEETARQSDASSARYLPRSHGLPGGSQPGRRVPVPRPVPCARPRCPPSGSARRSASRRQLRGPASQPGRTPETPLAAPRSRSPCSPTTPPQPGHPRLPMVAAPRASSDRRARSPGGRDSCPLTAALPSPLTSGSYDLVSRPCPATCAAGGVQTGRPDSTLGAGR